MPDFLPPRVRRAFHLDVRRRTSADVDDELRFHLEMRQRDFEGRAPQPEEP